MPQNPQSQRYTGMLGGLGSHDPMKQFEVENPIDKALQGMNMASNTMGKLQAGSTTKTETDKTLGGVLTSGISGFAAGTGLAASAGAFALETAAPLVASKTATGAMLGLTSNPLGWIIGGGMALAYLFS